MGIGHGQGDNNPTKKQKAWLAEIAEAYHLGDPWRAKHPSDKEYTWGIHNKQHTS